MTTSRGRRGRKPEMVFRSLEFRKNVLDELATPPLPHVTEFPKKEDTMDRFIVLLVILICGSVSCGDSGESSVVSYDVDSFRNDVAKKPHFVMFFAPWCGHCKRFMPVWDELGAKYNKEGSHVVIAKVDCTKQVSLCANHEVNGYPTLRFFGKGSESSVKYKGPRELEHLQKFIKEQTGSEDDSEDVEVPQALAALVEFHGDNFKKKIKHGIYFVKFYAPWCGHCQRLAPIWDQLAKTFEHESAVTIGKLDCTKFKELCSEFEVKGYPTLLWIVDGKKVAKYSGERTHGELKRFVLNHLGEASPHVAKVDQEPGSAVVVLTGENFENAIATGVTFVKFFAPWCGHCKRIAPTYEELGRKFAGHSHVVIAKLDCTQDINKELCHKHEVNGFPTLHLYRSGTQIAKYKGDRSLDDMAHFILSELKHDEL